MIFPLLFTLVFARFLENKFTNSFVLEYLAIPISAERVVLLNIMLKRTMHKNLMASRTQDDWLNDVLCRIGRMRRDERLVQTYRDCKWIKDAVNHKQDMEHIMRSPCKHKWLIFADVLQTRTEAILMQSLNAILPGAIHALTFEIPVPSEIRRAIGKRKTEYPHYGLLNADLLEVRPMMQQVLLRKAIKVWARLCIFYEQQFVFDNPIGFMDVEVLNVLLVEGYREYMPLVKLIGHKLQRIRMALEELRAQPSDSIKKIVAGYLQLMVWAIRERDTAKYYCDSLACLEVEIKQVLGFDLDDLNSFPTQPIQFINRPL